MTAAVLELLHGSVLLDQFSILDAQNFLPELWARSAHKGLTMISYYFPLSPPPPPRGGRFPRCFVDGLIIQACQLRWASSCTQLMSHALAYCAGPCTWVMRDIGTGCDSPGCAPGARAAHPARPKAVSGSPDTLTESVVLWHTSVGGSPARSWPKKPSWRGKPVTRKGPVLP